MTLHFSRNVLRVAAIAMGVLWGASSGQAGDNPLAPGWTLDQQASTLSFQSVKNGSVVETSGFSSFQGTINPDGTANLNIQLDSVDTGIDLRNVRMRFLFFETFKFPEATVETWIDPQEIAGLASKRRIRLPLDFTLSLHGAEEKFSAEVAATLITDTMVSVSTVTPVQIKVAPFGLEAGIQKLEEAAKVTIVPSSSVTFDLVFRRNAEEVEMVMAAASPAPAPEPASPAPAAATGSTSAGLGQVATATGADTAAPTAIAPRADSTVAAAATPAPAATEPSGGNVEIAALAPANTTVNETSGDFSLDECVGRFEILSRAQSIYFQSGSDELDPESVYFLNTLIDIIQRCPDLTIEVGGHTDSKGSAGLNQRLSEARAGSVVSYLVSGGIDAGRLAAKGYGELRPVADNGTDRGRARNRRIEFTPITE